jgi:hypothetical protein
MIHWDLRCDYEANYILRHDAVNPDKKFNTLMVDFFQSTRCSITGVCALSGNPFLVSADCIAHQFKICSCILKKSYYNFEDHILY